MYDPFIFIHSWTRWLVLVSIIFFFIKSAYGWMRKIPWSSHDDYFISAFTQLYSYQVAFGLFLLIGLSPVTKIGFQNPALISKDIMIFFWVLRHPLTMLLAYGTYQIGRVKSNKANPEKRFKIYTITFTVILAMILSAIPWPWLSYGRALFRWVL